MCRLRWTWRVPFNYKFFSADRPGCPLAPAGRKTVKHLVVHVGTHKTGTKSIQSFLDASQQSLRARNCRFYLGTQGVRTCHGELGLAALRADRDSFARHRFPDARGADYAAHVRQHVRGFLDRATERTVIFSNEDLCYLRFPDEVATLHDILGREHRVSIVVFLRERRDFLRSYRQQVLSVPGRQLASDPRSAFYVEPDSWLADYDSLVTAYVREFSPMHVEAVDYDAAVGADGSVIPAFMRAIGLPDVLPGEPARYFIHRSPPTA